MLKFIAILFIVFGALYFIDYLPVMDKAVDQTEYNNVLTWLKESNYLFYVVTDVTRKANKIIGIMPFILGIMILKRFYKASYLMAKIILFLKILLFPLLIIAIYQRFIYESNLTYMKSTDIQVGIFAMSFSIISMLMVLIIYIVCINLLKHKQRKEFRGQNTSGEFQGQ